MWFFPRSFRVFQAHSELETLILERTAELQHLSQRLLTVRDEERRKIARDLHDSTGQTLTSLKISVSLLQEECKGEPAKLALVSGIAELANTALEEIRTMSYLLHPPLLDEVGFACAAEWYVEGFAKRSGINVKAEIADLQERLPKKVEITLFRVLQESLTNVHRHSGASDASVHLQREAEAVTLEVRDFGKGIAKERFRLLRGSVETSVGLAGMRERLHELDGSLEIASAPDGTLVRATIPLCILPRLRQQEDCRRVADPAVA